MGRILTSDFGKRLIEAFGNAQKKEIAESMEVTTPAVSAYMAGKYPTADKLIFISEMTGVSIHWLLTGEGEKEIKASGKKFTTFLFDGYKESIGTTTVACHVAFILANRGYKILFVGHKNSPEDLMIIPFKRAISEEGYQAKAEIYFPTKIPNLHFFRKKGQSYVKDLKDQVKPFHRSLSLLKENYDFIICDAPSYENPFRSSDMPFNEFLNDAKVIIPFELGRSATDDVKKILQFVEAEATLGYQGELLGLFVCKENTGLRKKEIYQELAKDIEKFIGNRMLKTRIRKDDEWLDYNFTYPIDKKLESSSLYVDSLALTDEILTRIRLKV